MINFRFRILLKIADTDYYMSLLGLLARGLNKKNIKKYDNYSFRKQYSICVTKVKESKKISCKLFIWSQLFE